MELWVADPEQHCFNLGRKDQRLFFWQLMKSLCQASFIFCLLWAPIPLSMHLYYIVYCIGLSFLFDLVLVFPSISVMDSELRKDGETRPAALHFSSMHQSTCTHNYRGLQVDLLRTEGSFCLFVRLGIYLFIGIPCLFPLGNRDWV